MRTCAHRRTFSYTCFMPTNDPRATIPVVARELPGVDFS